MIIRVSCFKPTSDNWCGNFKIAADARHVDKGYVQVSFMQLLPSKLWRCCVWGNDDMGMEFDSHNKRIVQNIYIKVCLMEDVTILKLKQLGFTPA